VKIVLSCEHSSRAVPNHWRHVIDPSSRVLSSHRGYDVGARELATILADRFHAPLFAGRATRLLVDLNRPRHHPGVFSTYTRPLPDDDKQRLLRELHTPHWKHVSECVEASLKRSCPVVHVSVHTFTPRLGAQKRNADVGLLYDPTRPAESALCSAWQSCLMELGGGLRVRRNYPYRGVGAGLTSSLRKRLASLAYVGVELEVNQRLTKQPNWLIALEPIVVDSLHRAICLTI
jgi:predicted N-formylglutamate amidohydrolase